MTTAIVITVITLICTIIIAANNAFGLKDRAVKYLRRKLAVPTEADKLQQQRMESDRALFNRVREMIPSEYPMMIMREHNFGDAFRDSITSSMHDFVWESRKPEFEFHDTELEEIRARLEDELKHFLSTVAKHTWSVDEDFRRVPKEWLWKQPDRWRTVVTDLNDSADRIVAAYDELIRTGRRKLGE